MAEDFRHERWGLYRWGGGKWHVWEPCQTEGRTLCGMIVPQPHERPVMTRLTATEVVPEAAAVEGLGYVQVCRACRFFARETPLQARMEAGGHPVPVIEEVDGRLFESGTAFHREGWTNAGPPPEGSELP